MEPTGPPGTDPASHLVVLARAPIEGGVKSRLAAELGHPGALEVYTALLGSTAGTVAALLGQWRPTVEVLVEPPDALDAVRLLFEAVPSAAFGGQVAGDLGARLAAAFRSAFGAGARRVVVIGSDSPDLPARLLVDAFTALQLCDAVLGPAPDGGYYLIGLGRMLPTALEGIPWSTGRVLDVTLERLRAVVDPHRGLAILEEWPDLDTADDVRAYVARTGGGTPLARRLAGILAEARRGG